MPAARAHLASVCHFLPNLGDTVERQNVISVRQQDLARCMQMSWLLELRKIELLIFFVAMLAMVAGVLLLLDIALSPVSGQYPPEPIPLDPMALSTGIEACQV